MPTYLLHGFRWPRDLIRIHIILNNLDDAAAEWLMAPGTTKCLLRNFQELYPSIMTSLPKLRFIEQHDPNDITIKSQPYAYVADTVHEVNLGIDIDEVRGRGVSPEAWSAITELRDSLCANVKANVKLAWYVVVCGDEERWAPPTPSSEESNSRLGLHGSTGSSAVLSSRERTSSQSTNMDGSEGRNSQIAQRKPRSRSISRGFKKVFGGKGLKKATSMKDLKRPDAIHSSYSNYSNYQQPTSPPPPMPPPPLPGTAR